MKYWIIFIFVVASTFSNAANKDAKKTIKGNVYEIVNGEKRPLPMAFVYVKKSDLCSHSNFFGEFSMDIPKSTKVVNISYEGYKKQSIKINNKTSEFEIILSKDLSQFLTDK